MTAIVATYTSTIVNEADVQLTGICGVLAFWILWSDAGDLKMRSLFRASGAVFLCGVWRFVCYAPVTDFN